MAAVHATSQAHRQVVQLTHLFFVCLVSVLRSMREVNVTTHDVSRRPSSHGEFYIAACGFIAIQSLGFVNTLRT
jgi:hypothetical protein